VTRNNDSSAAAIGRFDESLAAALEESGLSRPAATAKATLFARCCKTLEQMDGAQLDEFQAYFVPGRIEVLGKHTDYAGGSSLVSAVERGFCLAAAPRNDSRMVVLDLARNESVTFSLSPEIVPRHGHWANYPMTVARRVIRNFPDGNRGVNVALVSDLPSASGMSSSSSLMVGIFFAWADVNQFWQHPDVPEELHDPLQLAGYLGTVENGQSFGRLTGDRGVGTFGGSEDHTAILCARPGFVSQYAYCPVRFQRHLAIPAGWTFAIASSGVVAAKTGAAQAQYNRAAQRAAAIAELWRQRTGYDDPHLAAVLARGEDAARQLRELLDHVPADGPFSSAELVDRFQHFVEENERIIPAAGDALAAGDLPGFGQLVDRSQHAAERWLGNQIPETIYLAAAARRCGAVAASAFGAGFGGSVWALVETDRVDRLLADWQQAYQTQFPSRGARAEFFATAPGPALFRIRMSPVFIK
jgi:galactokinase